MNFRLSRTEKIAYAIAFLLAFGMRFARLGALPLSDSEATLALQALQITQGTRPALASQVAYTNLTAILFFIFGSSNFLARFWPALTGSLLVLAPALFRQQLRPRTGMILAFFLAIDPAFVSFSRQVGSPILAVTCFAFAAGFWLQERKTIAGMFAALALMAGPSLWAGLLGLLLTWLLAQGLQARRTPQATEPPASEATPPSSQPSLQPVRNTQYVPFITGMFITLLAASMLFLLAPQGLAAWLAALPDYLRGWIQPSPVTSTRLLAALALYQPLGIVLALIAIVRGWMGGSRRVIRLSLWMLVALILALVYPAHQPSDLVWVLLPLWTLAAFELGHYFEFEREDRMELGGVIAFSLVLLSFAWLDLQAMNSTPLPSSQGNLRLGLLLGSLMIYAISLILVAYGWSMRIARVGGMWGLVVILGLYTLGSAWGSTGLRNPNAVEVWIEPSIAQADLLVQTANDLSDWSVGHIEAQPITIYGINSPALMWALRNYQVQVVAALDPNDTPPLIITPLQTSLGLEAAYRGQDFLWRQSASWEMLPSYWLRWITYRDLPLQPETIILWARNDLFIDGQKPGQ